MSQMEDAIVQVITENGGARPSCMFLTSGEDVLMRQIRAKEQAGVLSLEMQFLLGKLDALGKEHLGILLDRASNWEPKRKATSV